MGKAALRCLPNDEPTHDRGSIAPCSTALIRLSPGYTLTGNIVTIHSILGPFEPLRVRHTDQDFRHRDTDCGGGESAVCLALRSDRLYTLIYLTWIRHRIIAHT